MGYSGVRVLRLRSDGRTLLSGGADGMVIVWDVTSGKSRTLRCLISAGEQ